MLRRLRRVLRVAALAVVVLVAVLAAEVWLALRRDYLPTDHPLELDGVFGRRDAPALRLVVLGDSTAAGIGVDDPADAYPTLLARRLAAATDRRVDLSVLGVAGARVADVAEEQAPDAAALDPDVVFVGIGANDVTHLTSLGDVRAGIERAMRVLEDTGATVVVAGPPDMRAPAWHQPLRYLAGVRGRQVTAAVEDVAHARGARVVELADETGRFFAEAPEAHFSADEFHPGPLGYRRWADAIFPVLLDAYEADNAAAQRMSRDRHRSAVARGGTRMA